jgi:hypothetical protein
MCLNHKAFAFDWCAFQRHLAPILYDALSSNSISELTGFIEHHHSELNDPHFGHPLPEDWQSCMKNCDAQVYGEYALTLYYSPTNDFGVGDSWRSFSTDSDLQNAMRGEPFGPLHNHFDPSGLGSYFQTPDDFVSSLRILTRHRKNELIRFIDLIERCGVEGLGIYVTFVKRHGQCSRPTKA